MQPSAISSEESSVLPTRYATLNNPSQHPSLSPTTTLPSETPIYQCLKNDSCVNHPDTGSSESASREPNVVLTGINNSVNELVPKEKLRYNRTMAHRCCEISECEAGCCEQGNTTTIDATSCRRIGYERESQSDNELATLSCPPTTVPK